MRKTQAKSKILDVLTEDETRDIIENRTPDGAKVFKVLTTLKEIDAKLFKNLLKDFYLISIAFDDEGLIFDLTDEKQAFEFDFITNW